MMIRQSSAIARRCVAALSHGTTTTRLAAGLVLVATLTSLPAQGATVSKFGVRNVNGKSGLQQWPACGSISTESALADADLGHVNGWLRWDDLEPQMGAWQPATLEDFMKKALHIGQRPIVNFKISKNTNYMQGAGAGYTGPKPGDGALAFNPDAQPTYPAPAPKGYYAPLYDVSFKIADKIIDFYDPNVTVAGSCVPTPTDNTVYMVFEPEPWGDWYIGATLNTIAARSLNSYILCYLTMRRAVEDAQALRPLVNFKFSHGSIPRNQYLARYWWANWSTHEDTIRLQFRSLFERIPKILNFAIGKYEIETNADVAAYTNSLAYKSDGLWLDAMLIWAQLGFFDFNTQHPHGKPLFDAMDRQLVDAHLGSAALPWILTESAFERIDDVQACATMPPAVRWPLAEGLQGISETAWLADRTATEPSRVQSYAMYNYIRKWCSDLATERVLLDWKLEPLSPTPVALGPGVLAFCSPMISGNNNAGLLDTQRFYWSLFERVWDNPWTMQSTGPEPPATAIHNCEPTRYDYYAPTTAIAIRPTTAHQTIQPLPSMKALEYVSNALGAATLVETRSDDMDHAHFHFHTAATERVDVLWARSLWDADPRLVTVTVDAPGNLTTYEITTFAPDGAASTTPAVGDSSVEVTFGQEPVLVRWTP